MDERPLREAGAGSTGARDEGSRCGRMGIGASRGGPPQANVRFAAVMMVNEVILTAAANVEISAAYRHVARREKRGGGGIACHGLW